jgi:UDP-2,3-diacylglucosamine hydrolase
LRLQKLKLMQKTYFASDFHLGIEGRLTSLEREKKIVRWLDSIAPDAAAIYLVGDIFDYWFEYKQVIPKGYTRLLGKLAELRDAQIPIYFFTGNHDMWMFHYFEDELGIPIYRKPIVREIQGKTFFIGHGDGLGPDDYGYKFIKSVFNHPVNQWLFARLHPNLALGLMRMVSGRSRLRHDKELEKQFFGEAEWLVRYAERKILTVPADYFIFGHRHMPIDWTLQNQKSRYINLGEWFERCTYAVFDGNDISIQVFENKPVTIYKNKSFVMNGHVEERTHLSNKPIGLNRSI